jgi:predicted ATPase/DNA-binding SARP family transcriptional activator
MQELRVCLLGGLVIAGRSGSRLTIPSAAARSLFAYLLTYRERPHTRDLLAGTFWPDLPDATARQRLSQALWQIRRAVAPHTILATEGDTVQIEPGLPLWSDVQEFRALGSATELDSKRLEAAATLYCGEFMAGYYDDWILVERERLRDRYLSILEQLISVYRCGGEYEQALASARRLAAADPWREEAHREVMRLCHLLDRDAEALKQFQVCHEVLAGELGCQPSPDTVALAREIGTRSDLVRLPLLPATARSAGAPYLERPDLLPLVGRREELAALLRLLEAAAGGSGGLCLVYGEAGVGKSRLLRELAGNARWRELRVVWGQCYELAPPLAYQPLVEALRACLPALAQSPLGAPWDAALASLLPERASGLPGTIGQPPVPPLAPEEERRRLLEALTRAFLALSQRVPHLVLLEDVHWMDSASLDVLHYLLPRLPASRLLLVLSARPEELDGPAGRALAAMESTRLPRRLDLGRLGQPETGELVARALDLNRPAPHFSARLHAETEGNPFFLVETLRELVDAGVLFRDQSGTWTTPWDDLTEDYVELPLVAGVVQSIERRLAHLPAGYQDLLGLASVIGRGIGFAIWQSASRQDERVVLQAADELCARGLLSASTPESPRLAHADYGFAHDQIRRVVYRRLPAPRRRLYHRRVAEALSDLALGAPADLAHHWMQAEEWPKAAAYHRLAGDRAQAVYAHGEAAEHYAQALAARSQCPGPADPSTEFELRLAREAVCAWRGERPAQAEELAALEALCGVLDDGGPQAAGRQAEVMLRRVRYATVTGDYAAAIAAASHAVDLALRANDRHQEARAYLGWGQALWHQGAYEAALGRLEQARQLAHAAGLSSTIADAQLALGRVYLSQGAYARADEHLAQACTLYGQAGDPRGEAQALENLGRVSRLRGDYEEGKRYFEQTLQVSREIGDRRGESRALHCLGGIWINKGDHVQAESLLEQALTIAQETADREAQSSLLSTLGVLMNRWSAYSRAREYLEQSLDICREIGDRPGELASLTNLAIVLLCQGDCGRALSLGEESRHIGRALGDPRYEGWALLTLGRISARLGSYARAEMHYAPALDIAREIGDRHLEAVILHFSSLLAHRRDDDRTALELGEQALLIAREIGEPVEVAYALTSQGQALAGLGRWDEARAAFGQAVEIRRQLGQHSLAAESLAGLARTAQAQGDVDQATAHVEEILPILDAGTLEGAEEPLWVYLICYRVLSAGADSRREGILAAAYGLLQARSARIADEELRRSFIENIAAHREIVAAYERCQPAAHAVDRPAGQQVSLPRADAGQGRPLPGDECMTVTWMVDSPEDEAIAGKVARRRHRLLRLLIQARAQGAAPTQQHLADALGVSRRTIERDVAALRERDPDLALSAGPGPASSTD